MEERATISRRAFLTGDRGGHDFLQQDRIALPPTAVISGACLAMHGVACQSCRDACPQDAIVFRPRAGGPFLPEVDETVCNGCGACVTPCPAEAIVVTASQTEPARG